MSINYLSLETFCKDLTDGFPQNIDLFKLKTCLLELCYCQSLFV